jgi:predicted DNA-binding transcriptional regulator YafY
VRADRLVAALLLMQSRGRVTAAELADELEVSVATARRDLEALSAGGIPVYPQPGRGGGWSLVGGARTDLSGLSAAEAQALFLLTGPAVSVSAEARAALRKLVRALPQTFRVDAEAAAGATMIDPTRWGERDRRRPELVDLLQAAVVRRRKVRLTYAGRTRERTERLIDPWGLVDKDDTWYLLAGTDRGQRTFRVDRIVAAEPTAEAAQRPDDFALATAWQEVVGEVERRRSRTWATVLIEARFVPVLRDQFGRHCHADRRGRRRPRPGPPRRADPARHRPPPGRVGGHDRGAGAGVGPGRAGADRRRAHRPLRRRGLTRARPRSPRASALGLVAVVPAAGGGVLPDPGQ